MTQTQATEKKSKKMRAVTAEAAEAAPVELRERVEQVRDLVENVRDKAEVAFRDKPYLVPVAAGAVGFGVGLLFGSKLTRFIVFTAVGGIISEALGGEIKRMAGDFMGEFQNRLGEGEPEAEGSSST